MVIANMLDLTTTQANAILQPSSTGYSLFSNSVRPVPGNSITLNSLALISKTEPLLLVTSDGLIINSSSAESN